MGYEKKNGAKVTNCSDSTSTFWREEKTDEKLWRDVEVYRQISLSGISRRLLVLGIIVDAKWSEESNGIISFRIPFILGEDFSVSPKTILGLEDTGFGGLNGGAK